VRREYKYAILWGFFKVLFIKKVFLPLSHTRLDIYKISKQFVLLCYRETAEFPAHEKFGLTQQIRRAALSVHLNLSEGSSRKSLQERKRFYEIARGSLIEVDTGLDIAANLQYTNAEKLKPVGYCLSRCFQMLSKMITQ
jgi:four helix bundle protein